MPSAPITISASARPPSSNSSATPPPLLLEGDQLLAEFDGAGGDIVGQDLVEVAAVDDHVAGAERRLADIAHVVAEHGLAGIEFPADPVLRPESDFEELPFDSRGAQHLHHVGADIDARTEPRELRRLLVDPDAVAAPFQKRRGDQASEPGADDGDFPIGAQGFLLRC